MYATKIKIGLNQNMNEDPVKMLRGLGNPTFEAGLEQATC